MNEKNYARETSMNDKNHARKQIMHDSTCKAGLERQKVSGSSSFPGTPMTRWKIQIEVGIMKIKFIPDYVYLGLLGLLEKVQEGFSYSLMLSNSSYDILSEQGYTSLPRRYQKSDEQQDEKNIF